MIEPVGVARLKQGSSGPAAASSRYAALLNKLFGGIKFGELVLELPTGTKLKFVGENPGERAIIQIHRWRVLRRTLMRRDIGFAEAYRDGDWSTPDLWSVLTWGLHNHDKATHFDDGSWFARIWNSTRHALRSNSRRTSRKNVAAHYDLGNNFYSAWLDSGMNYSSGLFEEDSMTLEDAQSAKLARVCELLDLRSGERILEIGCGWGALAERLVKNHSCHVIGLTLSSQQRAYSITRLASQNLNSFEIRFQDYRDIKGCFDRIVSIEMLEAVGEAYWPTFFKTLHDRLAPGGTAVIQTITIDEQRYQTYRTRPDFIQLHIFPGGMLPTKTIVKKQAERAGLQVNSIEAFGQSYAMTLKEWRKRFKASEKQMLHLGFDDRFKRLWNYYFVYCQVGFENSAVDVCLFRLTKTPHEKK